MCSAATTGMPRRATTSRYAWMDHIEFIRVISLFPGQVADVERGLAEKLSECNRMLTQRMSILELQMTVAPVAVRCWMVFIFVLDSNLTSFNVIQF